MRTIGFNVIGGGMRWAVVEGSLAEPRLVERGREVHGDDLPLPQRMAWFRGGFDALLTRFSPDRVGYRMHMGRAMTQEQVATFHYPWGLLLSACDRPEPIQAVEFTGSSLTAKRFGLGKGEKPMERVDEIVGKHPPHWDDHQRYAVCAAWGALG